jgi:hypothetical protein
MTGLRIEQSFSLRNVWEGQVHAALNHIRARLSRFDVIAEADDGILVISIENETDYDLAANCFHVACILDYVLDEAGLMWGKHRQWMDVPKVAYNSSPFLTLVR